MSRVLVTGGSGFIGSAIVKKFLNLGYTVNILDNGFRNHAVQSESRSKSINYFEGDIRNSALVLEASKNVDLVIHAAYINGTENFYKIPFDILEVGIKGTLNVLDAIKTENIKKLVYVSSSETYQDAQIIPTPEQVPLVVPNVDNPRYSYGGGKIASELLIANYAKQHDLNYKIIRPHNIYGPNMGHEHVIPQLLSKFYNAKLNNKFSIEIQGTGRETRAFCYIDDFIDGFIRVCTSDQMNEIYNIGTNEEITILNLCTEIGKIIGTEFSIISSPIQEGSPLRRCPNIGKINLLGYIPKIKISEGLSKTMEWYFQNFEDKQYE